MAVFLTHMALDLTMKETHSFLLSPTLQHRLILDSFPGEKLHILWRIDSISGRIWLVILSPIRPTLDALHQMCGFQGVFPSWHILDYDTVLYDAIQDSVHPFILCASPSGEVRKPDSLYPDPRMLFHWLKQHAPDCGFEIVSLDSITGRWVHVESHYLLYGRWEGKLRIIDEEQFSQCTSDGIGPCRDLGAGLITID